MSEPLRILVIDDDPDMLILLTALLEHLGAAVRTASTPAEVQTAITQPTDLVLLDLVMPGDSYAQIVQSLTHVRLAAPIALMSGSDTTTLATARHDLSTRGLRVVHTLTKPVRLDALATMIATTAQRTSSER